MTSEQHRIKAVVTAPMHQPELRELSGIADVVVISSPEGSLDDGIQLSSADLMGVNVLVVENATIDASVLDAAPALELVVSCRSNPVNVDLAACAERSIKVEATPGRNADATADLAFGLLLSCVRQIPRAERWLRAGKWNREDPHESYRTFRGMSLNGKTLGLIGLGAVGGRMARRGAGFGMTVVAHDPVPDVDGELDFVQRLAMGELLARVDVLSIHAPLTRDTVGLIGPAELAQLKPGTVLINAARAALVDESALIDALETGQLGAAGLDVFVEEPIALTDRLLEFPNVVLTPHIGGASDDVITNHGRTAVAAIARLASNDDTP